MRPLPFAAPALLTALLALLPACGGGGAERFGNDNSQTGPSPVPPQSLSVLTRNVYYGADLAGAIAAVSAGDPEAIVAAVTQVRADLEATDFRVRAQALADEIATRRPDLVGLQEAALWRVQSPSDAFEAAPTPAVEVAFDFVTLLQQALEERQLTYHALVVSEGFDVELPHVDAQGGLSDLRLTDREVILARHDFRYGPERTLHNLVAGRFATNLVLESGFEALRGWAAVDVTERGTTTRFVTTHLEAELPEVRDAQAAELLAALHGFGGDVVLVGDLNDDARAPAPQGPYAQLRAAGFSDAWTRHHASATGPTCCLDALLADAAATATERLDLVLSRGAWVASGVALVGADPEERRGGLWASDHVGVFAGFSR